MAGLKVVAKKHEPGTSKVTPHTTLDIEAKVVEYDKLKEEGKFIEDRKKVLATEIKDFASKYGVKNNTGSFYCENELFVFGSQAKKSISFNQERTLAYLKKKGLTDAIKVIETFDAKMVEDYVNSGEISEKDLKEITDMSISFSIDVKRKDEIVEAELAQVASTKKKVTAKVKK